MGFWKRFTGEEPSLWAQFWNYDNPGSFGEYMTSYALTNLPGYGKILRNVYVPYKGRTSEIDVLLVHEKGIYVFESKNYSGWIFGSADNSKWTQCLQSKKKIQFYNPILQNRTHLKALMEYLQVGDLQRYHSYIIFSERCTLKTVPENTNEYIIVRRPDMLKSLKRNLNGREKVFSTEEVDAIKAKLIGLTNRSEKEKQQHIDEIKATLAKRTNPLKEELQHVEEVLEAKPADITKASEELQRVEEVLEAKPADITKASEKLQHVEESVEAKPADITKSSEELQHVEEVVEAKPADITKASEELQQPIEEIETELFEIPTCPNCKIPMIERTASRGANAGKKFWGCKNYPKCRQTKAID